MSRGGWKSTSWLEDSLYKEGFSAVRVRECLGVSERVYKNVIKNPYVYLSLKQIKDLQMFTGISFSKLITLCMLRPVPLDKMTKEEVKLYNDVKMPSKRKTIFNP